jgi:hypothetical protein
MMAQLTLIHILAKTRLTSTFFFIPMGSW